MRYARMSAVSGIAICLLVVSPVAHAATATVSAQDKQFLQKSAAGDIFEIEGGTLAMQRGQTAQTRAYGQRLVTDHTKSLSDAKTLAAKLNITLPTQPDATMQAMLDSFRNASTSAFDRVYAAGEVKDHTEDIADANKEVTTGSNSSVISNAKNELPTLQTHLQLGQQLLAAVTSTTPTTVQAGSGGTADRVPVIPRSGVAALAAVSIGLILAGITTRRRRRV